MSSDHDRKHYYWQTRDGQVLRIKDMADSHLLNTIRYLRRVIGTIKFEEELVHASALTMIRGEYASIAAEQDLDDMLDMSPIEYLVVREPRYWIMLCLAKHRGLNVNELYYEAELARAA